MDALEILADYFTGGTVGHNSVCLQLRPPHSTFAQKFFDARKALGIDGYATKDDALAALRTALSSDMREKSNG